MTSQSETGHAKNLSNFALLISYCLSYEIKFQPSSDKIKIPALQTKHTDCQNLMQAVNIASIPFIEAVNQRQILFDPLRTFITRVVNSAEASDITVQDIADIKTYARKIQGRRASKKTEKSHSASQMSFVQRIDHLSSLVEFLAVLTKYTPNETELTVASIRTMITNMEDASSLIYSLEPALGNARIARNKAMYEKDTGLTELTKKVKKYVKSVFGSTSEEYKQIAALKFKRFYD